MTTPGFRLYRNASQRLTIELAGEIDEDTALYCERETRADLALVPDASLRVVWDLTGVTGYSLDARLVLVRLQQFLAIKADRTAYVAVEPTARSLALWAARMGDQARACIAADREAAEAWLIDSCGEARGAVAKLDRIGSVRRQLTSKTAIS
jgi:hypothetical protein